MTDSTFNAAGNAVATPQRRDIGIKRRYAAERRFRLYGIVAIAIGVFFLCALLFSVFSKGYTAFGQTTIYLPVKLDEQVIDPGNKRATDPNVLITANYPLLVRNALAEKLGVASTDRAQLREVGRFFSDGVRVQLRQMVMDNPSLIGTTQTVPVLAAADIDSAYKGQIDLSVAEANRKVSDRQVAWIKTLTDEGMMSEAFNWGLFTNGASSRPETSGLGVALVGSFYMMLIVLVLALPIGVAASIYLEEFAKKNRLTDLIEVNINNLAACVRSAWSCSLHQLLQPAAFSLHCWWSGADIDDVANHHHRNTFGTSRCTTIDPCGGFGARCFEDADGFPSCAAARGTWYSDRNDYRSGSGSW